MFLTSRHRTSRHQRLLALLAAVAVIASACSSGSSDADVAVATTEAPAPPSTDEPAQTTTTTEAVDTTTSTAAPLLVDIVDWEICGELECATVEVPADYDDPSLGTINIAINVLRASDTDRRLGILMVNPGGPGAPGKSLAEAFTFGVFPAELSERFDIVGFDPRGVGESEPTFACGESGDQLELLADIEDLYDTPEEIAAGEAAVALCVESMGDIAGRIHTDFVVRDMDEIRKAMGEEQISYLGYSYGSLIGTWYATLFPDNVRAMVIDGADNPLDEEDTFQERLESAREEIQPIEDLLGEALAACADTTCPIYNNGDPVGYYYNAANKFGLVNEANLNNDDVAFLALITPLYSESQWPMLWDALAALQERNDPSVFSELSEFQLGADPGQVNITAHINCLDGWALRPEKTREVRLAESAEFFAIEDQLNTEFPLLAAVGDSEPGTCVFYDTIAPEPLAVPLDGGGVPILVVGNTSDPVTSFGESEELATEILQNGILLTVDHPDHTVYPWNECVNEAVNRVLLEVDYPTDNVDCEREESNNEAVLAVTCEQLAPQLKPGLEGDELDTVCTRFVADAIARLGEETVNDALIEEDEVAGAQLLGVLNDILAES